MDITGIGFAILRGIFDSFRGMLAVIHVDSELQKRQVLRLSYAQTPLRRKPSGSRETTPARTINNRNEEATVVSRIVQCGLLNGVIFLVSIIGFEYGFLPIMKIVVSCLFGFESAIAKTIWYWSQLMMEYIFQALWVIPLFAISRFINNCWFQDIAQSAYKYSRGRSSANIGLSKTIADVFFSTLIEALFLFQAIFITYIPVFYILGYSLYLVHLSLLYSLYSFEYKWGEMGWELHKRLASIETHWPYFIGFGIPLVALTQLTASVVINACIFSMLFPFFIISANEAVPVYAQCTPLRLFSPVIALSNVIFSAVFAMRARNEISLKMKNSRQIR